MVQRTTRITVETETLLVVRRVRAALAWCPECLADVDAVTLTPDSFAERATAAQVQQWLDTGKLHLWHASDGTVHICVASLLACGRNPRVG